MKATYMPVLCSIILLCTPEKFWIASQTFRSFQFFIVPLDLCVFLIVTIYHLHIPASWGSWHHLDFSSLGPESDKTFNIVNNLILLDQQQYIQGKGKDFYLKK